MALSLGTLYVNDGETENFGNVDSFYSLRDCAGSIMSKRSLAGESHTIRSKAMGLE